jgi:CRISPR-associated protein Csd1
LILSSLCDYYDLLNKIEESDISPFGYEKINASYVAVIDNNGELQDIISINHLNNKSQQFLMPLSLKSTSISASPVCDNFEYIFGISGDKGIKSTSPIKFETARKLHYELFSDSVSLEGMAINKFFQNWDINKSWDNEIILKHYSDKGKAFSGNVIFRLVGQLNYFHEVPEIIEKWQEMLKKSKKDESELIAQCSITGEISSISRLHKQLKGIRDASIMGASLVCFNKDADESYGLEQSRNAAVSEEAAFKYITALQHLLFSSSQKIYIGDATTVIWAGDIDQRYTDIFLELFNNPNHDVDTISEDVKTREIVKGLLIDGTKGVYNEAKLNEDMKFYVLGLSPNAGRTSVRFFYYDTFFSFCEKIKQHYNDMQIYGGQNGKKYIKTNSILFATVNSKSKDKKINPLLSGSLTNAVLSGAMYPYIIFNQTIIRVKIEHDVNQTRAAIIKGYLVRKSRILNLKEEISMYLNENSKNQAYVLGRIFSILEKIQKNAQGENLNTTIKDKYFSTACSNPSLVFPNLIKLSHHHLNKIEGNFWQIQLGECLSLIEIDSFPKSFNMENQGRFILGYYQQTQKNYEKKQVK